MAYRCFECKKEVDSARVERRVICPFCGSRILTKTRPTVIKKVKAR